MRSAGFTLIEVMVTLVVISLVLLLGMPSFGEVFSSNKTRSVTDMVFSSLVEARMEAIKRNTTVTATISSTKVVLSAGTWSKTNIIPGNLNSNVAVTADTVPFDSSGQESNLATHNINITSSQCSANSSCYTVEVFGGGFIKTCNPSQVNTNAANYCSSS